MEEKLKQQSANCIKVVLFGPESTGKTTLAKQLAAYYKTLWVPEYSREYALLKLKENKELSEEDVIPIAIGQMRLENELTKKSNSMLICDTDLLETKVYSETYYPETKHPILEKYAQENVYDLYFLTYIDTPWEADDIRDKPTERESIFLTFKKALDKYNKPYILLKGSKEERLNLAVSYIDKLLKEKR